MATQRISCFYNSGFFKYSPHLDHSVERAYYFILCTARNIHGYCTEFKLRRSHWRYSFNSYFFNGNYWLFYIRKGFSHPTSMVAWTYTQFIFCLQLEFNPWFNRLFYCNSVYRHFLSQCWCQRNGPYTKTERLFFCITPCF